MASRSLLRRLSGRGGDKHSQQHHHQQQPQPQPPPDAAQFWDAHLRDFFPLQALSDARLSAAAVAATHARVHSFACADGADSGALYRRLSSQLASHATAVCAECAAFAAASSSSAAADGGAALLALFGARWRQWVRAARRVQTAFAALDRTWVPSQQALHADPPPPAQPQPPPLAELLRGCWREHVAQPLLPTLLDAALALARRERATAASGDDVTAFFGCVADMAEPALCRDAEARYVRDAEAQLAAAADALLLRGGGVGGAAYVREATRMLAAEEALAARRLRPAAQKALSDAAVRSLAARAREAMQTAFPRMLREGAYDDIRLLFALLSRLDRTALAPVREALGRYVRAASQQALNELAHSEQATGAEALVAELLEQQRSLETIHARAFCGDPALGTTLDRAMRDVVTMRRPDEICATVAAVLARASQLLALHCDSMLRRPKQTTTTTTTTTKTPQNPPAEALEKCQEAVLGLFRNLPDKDVFAISYEKLLARRLLNDLSSGLDAEKSMGAKLRASQGHAFSAKINRMIADVAVSRQINTDFAQECTRFKKQHMVPLNIFVLTFGTWPLQAPSSAYHPPAQVTSTLDAFRTFYDRRFPGRRLMFSHHLSRAEIVRNNSAQQQQQQPPKARLITTAYQLSILSLFTKKTCRRLRLGEMQERTLLHTEILRQHLAPLVARGVLAVVVATASHHTSEDNQPASSSSSEKAKLSETWNEETEFTVNDSFEPQHSRVSLLPPPASADATAHRMPHGFSMQNDRHMKLQAAILRVLKHSKGKAMPQTVLFQHVADAVDRWFDPDMPQFTQALASLLEQEFVRTTAGDKLEYVP